LEGVSEQIERAKMFEVGCDSENENTRTAVSGRAYTSFVRLKLVDFDLLTFVDIVCNVPSKVHTCAAAKTPHA